MSFLAVAQEEQPSVPLQVVIIVLIIAAIIYGLGYARAVMHRANRDYKTTKAAVPVLRRGFWSAWWKVVRVGFFVLIAIGILMFWAGRDVTKDDSQPAEPVPAKVSPPPKPSAKK